MGYRAGFVAMVGRPNVGKSTLLNALIGQKIAIASQRVQTTRFRIRGILTIPERGQIVFVDTPGFSKPMDTLGTFLTSEAQQAIADADLVLWVVDGTELPGKGDVWMAEQLQKSGKHVILILNKVDQVKNAERRETVKSAYERFFQEGVLCETLTVSALTGKRVQEIPKRLLRYLPESPAIYDAEEITEQRVRDIAQEMIREKAMQFTEDELPHSIAVVVEKFDETDVACTRITATLYVDHKSQKGMVIGKQGQMIKKIGQAARQEIEVLLDAPVFLDLNVKVKENWRKDAQFLKLLGLSS